MSDAKLMNAHVIDYLLWQIEKDAVWYWFPFKEKSAIGVVDFSNLIT